MRRRALDDDHVGRAIGPVEHREPLPVVLRAGIHASGSGTCTTRPSSVGEPQIVACRPTISSTASVFTRPACRRALVRLEVGHEAGDEQPDQRRPPCPPTSHGAQPRRRAPRARRRVGSAGGPATARAPVRAVHGRPHRLDPHAGRSCAASVRCRATSYAAVTDLNCSTSAADVPDAVGMQLLRERPEREPDLVGARRRLHPEHLVEIDRRPVAGAHGDHSTRSRRSSSSTTRSHRSAQSSQR